MLSVWKIYFCKFKGETGVKMKQFVFLVNSLVTWVNKLRFIINFVNVDISARLFHIPPPKKKIVHEWIYLL